MSLIWLPFKYNLVRLVQYSKPVSVVILRFEASRSVSLSRSALVSKLPDHLHAVIAVSLSGYFSRCALIKSLSYFSTSADCRTVRRLSSRILTTFGSGTESCVTIATIFSRFCMIAPALGGNWLSSNFNFVKLVRVVNWSILSIWLLLRSRSDRVVSRDK